MSLCRIAQAVRTNTAQEIQPLIVSQTAEQEIRHSVTRTPRETMKIIAS
jgi:hypothetical protein